MQSEKPRLIILGAGNISIYLTTLAARYGFDVTVIDNNPAYAVADKFPQAKSVLCREFAGCMDDLNIGADDYIAVLTRGHTYDPVCLLELMKFDEPRYVGVIGNKRRVAEMLDSIVPKGFSKERRGKLNTPIGFWIGSSTPDEIALSIIAEIVGRKNGVL